MTTTDSVRAWRPQIPGVREVFHAHFRRHAYPPHVHDVWTLLIVDDGDIRFDLDGHHHGCSSQTVTLLPPHVVHDGRAGPAGAFVKRVLYLDDTVVPDALIGHAVDMPTLRDRPLRRTLAAIHRGLDGGGEALQLESLLAIAGERVGARLRCRPVPADPYVPDLAEAVRAMLDARVTTGIALQEIAERLGVSAPLVVRRFSGTFGIAPHRYLISRRVQRARELLLDGWPPADVAGEVGFHDQAHLTRHFTRHVGTPPGRFQRSHG